MHGAPRQNHQTPSGQAELLILPSKRGVEYLDRVSISVAGYGRHSLTACGEWLGCVMVTVFQRA